MKLSDQHIFKGYWWLPDNPNDKVAGILTYTPGDRILLELIGCFKDDNGHIKGIFDDRSNEIPLIYGIDSNAKKISLIDCRKNRSSYNFSSEFPIMCYSTRMVIYDKHIKRIDEICDYTACIRFPELSHWAPPRAIEQVLYYDSEGKEINHSALNFPNLDSGKRTISFIPCKNGVQLFIKKAFSYNSGNLMLSPDIEQYSYVEITKPKKGMSIQEIFHEIHKFRQFLSLATKRQVRYQSIYLHDPNIKQNCENFPIYILIEQRPAINPPKIDRNRFLFRYEDVSSKLSDILVKWMSDSDNLQPIKNHLVDSIVYKPIVGSVDFLQVVQAIEGVWWRFKEDAYRSSLGLPKEKNTPLRTILTEIISSLSSIPTIKKSPIDIEAVIDSRHYYSHFMDKKERPKTLDGLELYEQTTKLRLVLLSLVFEIIGFTHHEIEVILSQQDR